MKAKLFTLAGILGLSIGIAQDIHFSQYNETPVLLNPALVAQQYNFRVNGLYRSQWASAKSPFNTFGVSAELAINKKKLKKGHLAAGLAFYRDVAGDGKISTTNIMFSLGGAIRAGDYSKICGAAVVGVGMRSVDYSKFRWENQFNGYEFDNAISSNENFQNSNYNYFDAGFGLNWHYSKTQTYITANNGTWFDVGVAAMHLNTPAYTYLGTSGEKLFMRYVAHGSFNIGLKGSKTILNPSFIYMMQGPSMEANAGFMWKFVLKDQSVFTTEKKAFLLGLGINYRFRDAAVVQLLLEMDKYAIGAAYDLNVSTLNNATKGLGGFEIMLRYNWNPGYGKGLGGSFNKTYMH